MRRERRVMTKKYRATFFHELLEQEDFFDFEFVMISNAAKPHIRDRNFGFQIFSKNEHLII